tara:strand:- start:233 stop:829 length:597 start_codon:yes stop_codon:yes gene_type:complete
MPIAVNGSGTITGISVGGLPDGIVDTDMLADNAVTSAKATGRGITMADMWRINADFTASGSSLTDITANLERIDSYGFGQLGTGMTQSSGVFSFPSTGIYHINFHLMCQSVYGEVDYHFAYILTTTDNSNYNNAALTVQEAQGTDHRYSMNVNFIFDVTNTSTHKVKFANYASRDDQKCFGQTNQTETSFTFLRLGDT